jgi:hypothetical protein
MRRRHFDPWHIPDTGDDIIDAHAEAGKVYNQRRRVSGIVS